MSRDNADEPLVLAEIRNDVAYITLNRPARRNSLTPPLLEALSAALDDLADSDLLAVVIAGAGPTFSSGGDVAGFAAHEGEARADYARSVVSLLNNAILKILALRMPVIARLQGFVTGGSAGFVFASDLAVIAEDAYIAPYYVDVGFAPDGGWTALLPHLIGRRRACEVQLQNRKIFAEEAHALGLATHIAAESEIDHMIAELTELLRSKSRTSLGATKRLLYDRETRDAIARALDRELETFIETIATDDADRAMRRFLGATG